MHRLALATLAVMLLAVAPADAASDDRVRREVRATWTQFKSALRHENGQRACSLMTARYRKVWTSNYARQYGIAGVGCVGIVEDEGREVYDDWMAGVSLRSIAVGYRGDRYMVKARTSRGGTVCFYGVSGGGWQVNRMASGNTRYCGATG